MEPRHTFASLERPAALAQKSEELRAHLLVGSASRCGIPRAISPQLYL